MGVLAKALKTQLCPVQPNCAQKHEV